MVGEIQILKGVLPRLNRGRRPSGSEESLVLNLFRGDRSRTSRVSLTPRSLLSFVSLRIMFELTLISSNTPSTSRPLPSISSLALSYFLNSLSNNPSNHSALTSPAPASRWIELASEITRLLTSSLEASPLAVEAIWVRAFERSERDSRRV